MKQYERLIITICFTFTRDHFDAEDLAQQTFLAAYANYNKFDGKNMKAWLTTIATNKCKDFLKSPARVTNSLSDEVCRVLRDDDDTPEDAFIKKQSQKDVKDLCEKLKEPYKTVSLNYFCKDIKLSDMSKESGQSIKTLQTQLYRSKKLLKTLWEEEYR